MKTLISTIFTGSLLFSAATTAVAADSASVMVGGCDVPLKTLCKMR